MAEIGASINLQVKGTSKLDRLINSASQLDSIVQSLNKTPLDISVQKATNQLDRFDTELKALKLNIGNSEKQIDRAGDAINDYATQIANLQSKLNELNPNTVAYNKVLDRQQKAIKGLAQAQNDLVKAQTDLESSQSRIGSATKSVENAKAAKRASEAINTLADDYLRLGRSQERGVSGTVLKKQLEPSIAQLGAQADVLKLVANNSRVASTEFNRFAIASQAAGQKIFESRQKQLSAVAFGLSSSAPKVGIGAGGISSIAGARNQIQELINLYPNIVKSEAALSSYSDELLRLQSLVPYTSEEFKKLESVIAELNQEISGIRPKVAPVKPVRALGPTSPVEGTLKQRQQYAEAVNNQYQKQLDLSEKIDRSAISVADKEAFSLQLNQALDALGENRLEDAQKMTIEINRQVSAMSRLQKTGVSAARKGGTQVFGALGTGFLPIGGELPSTVTPGGKKIRNLIPGSPAARLEEAKASRESTEAAVALAKQKQKAIEQEAEELRRGTQAATALGKQKLKALEQEANRLRSETAAAVALAQQKMREEAKAAAVVAVGRTGGTYRTGEFSPMGGARRLTSTLASGAIVEQSLLNLQSKGVNVADRLVQLQNALSAAKQDTFEISIKSLDALSDEVALAGKYAQLQRQIVAGQGGGPRSPRAGKESGFRPALTSEEISKQLDAIVKDFNAIAPKAGGAGENIASTFTAEIKQGASSAAASAKTFALAALEAIKDVFGIASPSRVMKEIAENLVSSFIAELVSNIPSVKAALEQTFSAKGGEYEQPGRARTRGPSLRMEGDPRFFAAFSGEPLSAGRPSPAGIFPAATPRVGAPGSGFPFQTYGMTRTQFPSDVPAALKAPRNQLSDTSAAVSEAIKEYRAAVNNFWEGEDSQFEAITKILTSSARLGAARLARRLQQGPDLTQAERIVEEARTIAAGQRRGTFAKISDVVTGDTRLGVSSAVANAYRRISDSLLNSLEALGFTVSDGFRDAVDRVRNAVPSVLGGIAGMLPPGGFGGGRGGGGGGATGAGGNAPQSIGDLKRALGLGDLAPIARATGEQIDELTARLSELRKRIDPTTQDFAELTKQLGVLGREQERRAPDAGFLTSRFGPRGGRAVSEGLVGGAFPLLFGQGLGAAVGGGLGGAAGGFAGGGLGFGLSLAGTALGTAFDTAVQSAKELGDALQKPVENFDQLAEKSFFSSKALEDTIKKTIEYGDTATASALIQEEAIKKLGVGGAQNLKTLGTESDRLNRAFAELGQQMQAVAAGPLASITGFFANIFGQAAAASRVRLLRANLNPEQTGQFNQEVRQRLQQQGIQRGFFAPSAPTDAEIGMLQERGALQDIVDKWQAIEVQGKIKLDPKQVIESEINALQKKLEVFDIGKSLKDQFRSAAREQEDLDRQRADLVRSYEESIGDIRRRVENEVASRRFSVLEQENQLLDQQGQNRLRQLQLINQEIIAGAGQGQRPEVEEAARRAAEIVAQFTEDQLSAEQEAAKIKRDAALDALKFDYQATEFKASIEKEVSRLNVETARRVADINEQVRRRNEEFDNRRFAIEKQIADLQLKMMQNELALATKNADLPIEARQAAFDLYRLVGEQRKEVMKTAAPPALRGVGQVGGGGVPTQNIDAVVLQQRQAIAAVVNAALEAQDLLSQQGIQNFRNSIDTLIKGVEAPINAINQSILDADKERTRYSELISQGLTETVAQRVVEIEKAKELAIAQLDTIINELEKRKAVEATTEALRAQIDTEIQGIKDRKKALEEAAGTAPTDGKPGTGTIGKAIESERGREIQDFITRAQAELNNFEAYAVRVSQSIGDALGNSIADGVNNMIDGTKTAQEVFADLLKNIANMLLQESTRMIATYIAIGIARMFAFGSVSQTAKSFEMPSKAFIPKGGFRLPGAANGAYFDNGIAAFANGGTFTNSIVSSPTLFRFADGGVTRMGVMGEADPEAIMPLKRGPGGRLGVDASGSGGDNIAVTVNVDAKGSSVQGDDQRGNQLGRAISAAVQQELIKQKRPGGLLA